MKIYNEFFKEMTPHEWEQFAEALLRDYGFNIIEKPSIGINGGRDLLVEYEGLKYAVSCKHFINCISPRLN